MQDLWFRFLYSESRVPGFGTQNPGRVGYLVRNLCFRIHPKP